MIEYDCMINIERGKVMREQITQSIRDILSYTMGPALIVAMIICAFFGIELNLCTAYAATKMIKVKGTVYEMDNKKGGYNYSGRRSSYSTKKNTYGVFSVNGDLIRDGYKNKVMSLDTRDDHVKFLYSYDDAILKADAKRTWTLVNDSSEKIGDISLGGKSGKGTVVVQSSFDGTRWSTDYIATDAFEKVPSNSQKYLYTTNENQTINGCYYRVTVAYTTKRKSGKYDVGPIKVGTKYDYKKHIEVYDFYIRNSEENEKAAKSTDLPVYNFNSTPVNTGMNNGYSGRKPISTDDLHNGWNIGQFYINGFSGNPHFNTVDENKRENPIFLKNVGDKVTLWFDLKQRDLNRLNGNGHLSINEDSDGSDQDMNQGYQNFGKGALIIKFTDYQNRSKTNVYKDYLKAADTTVANTKVQLFEEGDYEVALDYEIKDESPLVWNIPKPAKYSSYRVSFKFSVRNSNCMVYPMTLDGRGELTKPYTDKGFKLDLAKSRYLDITVVRMVTKGHELDTRENQISSDLEEYTEEGVYKFTVKNRYTGEEVSKIVYVGTDNFLKAYAVYGGQKSIDDLLSLQKEGAIFNDDGTISVSERGEQEELDKVAQTVSAESNDQNNTDTKDIENGANDSGTDKDMYQRERTYMPAILIIVILALGITLSCLIKRKKEQNKEKDDEDKSDELDETDNEQDNK